MLADSLRTDPSCFRILEPLDPLLIELREWSRIAAERGEDLLRLANRMWTHLWRYYPQFLNHTDAMPVSIASVTGCARNVLGARVVNARSCDRA